MWVSRFLWGLWDSLGNKPCGFPLLAVMCGVRVGEGHLSLMTFSLPLYFTVMPLASGLNFCALFFEQYTMVKVRFVSMPGKEPRRWPIVSVLAASS